MVVGGKFCGGGASDGGGTGSRRRKLARPRGVVGEDMDHVALAAGQAGLLLVGVAGVGVGHARDVGERRARGPSRCRPRRPGSGTVCTTCFVRDGDDPDVVAPAAGRDRPVEAPVGRDRAAGREVARGRRACRPAAGGGRCRADARLGPMMPSSAASAAAASSSTSSSSPSSSSRTAGPRSSRHRAPSAASRAGGRSGRRAPVPIGKPKRSARSSSAARSLVVRLLAVDHVAAAQRAGRWRRCGPGRAGRAARSSGWPSSCSGRCCWPARRGS